MRVLLPERGGRCLLWRLGRSLWSRRTSARRYEQRDEGVIPNNQNETFDSFIV